MPLFINLQVDFLFGFGVFMEFQNILGVGATHRIYEGDTFDMKGTGLLNHIFGGKLPLKSDKVIDLEYSEVTIDQELGRMRAGTQAGESGRRAQPPAPLKALRLS